MKKKVLSLLVVAVLLISVLAVTAITAGANVVYGKMDAENPDSLTRYCEHCGKSVTWTAWGGTTALNTSFTTDAHVFLTADTTKTLSLSKGQDLVLNLNGNDVTVAGRGALIEGKDTKLSIVDYSSSNVDEHGTVSATGQTKDSGETAGAYKNTGIFQLYSSKTANTGIVLNIYGGNYRLADTHNVIRSGGVVNVGTRTTLNIHGGKLYGGDLTSFDEKGFADAYSRGSALYISGGTVNIHSGEIVGGAANLGGAVYIGGGTVTQFGGTINGGTANLGGAVYFVGGAFTQSGGTINGGTVNSRGDAVDGENITYPGHGAAVYVAENKAFTMSGGTINGGTANDGTYTNAAGKTATVNGNGGAVYLAKNATMNMSNGAVVDGGTAYYGGAVAVYTGAELTMSGEETTIKNGQATKCGGNIYLLGTVTMNNGKIIDGKTDTTKKTNADGGNVLMSGTGARFNMLDGEVSGGQAVRGGNFRIWDSGQLTVSGGEIKDGVTVGNTSYSARGGNIMTDKNAVITLKGDAVVSGGTAASTGTSIALYGSETTQKGATLKIQENAKVIGDPTKTGDKLQTYGLIYAQCAHTDEQYYAKIEISGNGSVEGVESKYAGASIRLEKGAILSMTGGKVTGGTSTDYNGGNIYAVGTSKVNISGTAEVSNGTARLGGNIYIKDCAFNMSGGTIKDGTAETTLVKNSKDETKADTDNGLGGNVYLGGTMTFAFSGGSIEGGTNTNMTSAIAKEQGYTGGMANYSNNGGSVYVASDVTVNMSGDASISGGNSYNAAGNVRLNGTLNMSGNASISGGKIDGKVSTSSGNIQAYGTSATLTMTDSASITNGGVSLYSAKEVTLSGTPTISIMTVAATFKTSDFGDKLIDATGMTGGSVNVVIADSAQKEIPFLKGTGTNKVYFTTTKDGQGVAWNADNQLYISDSTATILVDDVAYGYAKLQDAVNAYSDGVVKLAADVEENVTMSGDLVLDMNGKTLTGNITGTGTLQGMDTENNDYEGCGKIVGTITGVQLSPSYNFTTDTGVVRTYLALTDEDAGETSFHRVYLKITSTMLRPNYQIEKENGEKEYAPGVYYKVTIAGDTHVLNAIETYGVAAGKGEVPTALATGAFSAFDIAEDAQPATAITNNGTMIAGVMKETNETNKNVTNAETTLYGVPYITLENVVDADGNKVVIMGAAQGTTLKTALSAAYELWNNSGLTHADQITAMTQLHGAFEDEMVVLQLSAPEAAE